VFFHLRWTNKRLETLFPIIGKNFTASIGSRIGDNPNHAAQTLIAGNENERAW
jgi:hypothetical protein